MPNKLRSASSGLTRRLGSLSAPVLGLIGVLIASGVGAGGFYAYQTYDYIQHDNDFCLSCHLMENPFQRFSQSAHRGLGCKACHQPNMIERSKMALTQIVENPGEVGQHAAVPNKRCAECHIDGEPEKWELIRNSAGHKVHLESQDSTLQGLQCVECHATTLHEFAATDQTCGQSGCHEDDAIQLGGMSDLTIHCAACHGFSSPVTAAADADEIESALAPDRESCLSCHQMRELVELPDPDPHEGKCASCHNPHEQKKSAEAVQSCENAGCHTDADTLSAFHRGIEHEIADDCTQCHKAHDFHIEGTDCLSCHKNIFDDRTGPGIRGGSEAAGSDFEVLRAGGVGIGWWEHRVQAVQTVQQKAPTFRHSEHEDLECLQCHKSEEGHGTITVTTVRDCRSCHHVAPTSDDCARCHESSESTGDPYSLTRTLDLTVGLTAPRRLPFDHADHTEKECASCHTEGLALAATDVDCQSCHEEHHEVENECASCHLEPPVSAHPLSETHQGCAGSGCHEDGTFSEVPTARNACLVCHRKQTDHRPDGECVECHVLGPSADRRLVR
jgi:nitrate/TMAO reductase-like tetraheme cytochrome c subunit